MNLNSTVLFLTALIISGCATLNGPFKIFKPRSSSIEMAQVLNENQFVEEFSLKAKFAYVLDDKGGSGRFIWHYKDNQDEIDIFSPFNNQIAKIIYSENDKRIIDMHGKILSGNDFDQYIQSLFGKNISPDLFRHLITNHIERINNLHKDDNHLNRPIHFYDNDWNININAFKTQNGFTIPSKILISQGTFSFNFLVEEIIDIAGK